MNTSKVENSDHANDMIRTMVILLFAILLREICTDTVNWYWALALALVVFVLYVFKRLTFLPGKTKSNSFEVYQMEDSASASRKGQ